MGRWLVAAGLLLTGAGQTGDLRGYVSDQNWFARRAGRPPGVGYYEFAVTACGSGWVSAPPFGGTSTDVFGRFELRLPGGTYQVASWSVWWRPALAFNVVAPATGTGPLVDLRLSATMWGYPAFWDDRGYHEFGQTFVATGAISMIYLRCPKTGRNLRYTLTVHEKGPGGASVGESRSFGEGDQRPVYGFGEMPTVAGRRYYLRVRTASPALGGVVMQMDPRPDFADPMPGGCLYLGGAGGVTAFPDRDLGVVIMADDDGLLTNLNTRGSGATLSGRRLGQTWVARGTSLVLAAFWIADPAAPLYEVRVYAGGPEGAPVGPPKRTRPPRVTADPEMMALWAPGECPLVPGDVYYVEVTRVDGGTINVAYANSGNPFAYGAAHRNRVAMSGHDLAGLLMEEASSGSATHPQVRITTAPWVAESDRQPHELIVQWRTDVPADSRVEIAPGTPPYIHEVSDSTAIREHRVVLRNLPAHTLHHLRVSSRAPDHRPAVGRDFTVTTRPASRNLLANPGFETGAGGSPRKPVPGWSTKGSSLDMAGADGSWFWGIPPHGGSWLFEGAVNAGKADGVLFQRVRVTPGRTYAFSAWVTTWMRENNTWKYDVWNDRGRLSHVRLGIDPAGGAQPTGSRVVWTPRFYGHRHYVNAGLAAVARGSFLTVFVEMKGQGGDWHLFGVDDCVLTEVTPAPATLRRPEVGIDGSVRYRVQAEVGSWQRMESSSDLIQWTPWTNVFNADGWEEVVDDQAPRPPRNFYRAITLPRLGVSQ